MVVAKAAAVMVGLKVSWCGIFFHARGLSISLWSP